MRFYRIMSLLLDYPGREFCQHLDELAATLPDLNLHPEDRGTLERFIRWCGSLPETELQAHYVETFDLMPDHSLHLTHHLMEEQDRDRGATLANLKTFFASQGLEICNSELPDYLPLLLESVAELEDPSKGTVLLGQAAPAISELARALQASDSPWAALLALLEQHLDPAQHLAPVAA